MALEVRAALHTTVEQMAAGEFTKMAQTIVAIGEAQQEAALKQERRWFRSPKLRRVSEEGG